MHTALQVGLEILIDRVGVHARAGIAPHVRGVLVEHYELLRVLDRQLAEHDLVEQRKDGRVGADPESQREDRHSGKQAIAAKAAKRQFQVG